MLDQIQPPSIRNRRGAEGDKCANDAGGCERRTESWGEGECCQEGAGKVSRGQLRQLASILKSSWFGPPFRFAKPLAMHEQAVGALHLTCLETHTGREWERAKSGACVDRYRSGTTFHRVDRPRVRGEACPVCSVDERQAESRFTPGGHHGICISISACISVWHRACEDEEPAHVVDRLVCNTRLQNELP